MLKSQIKVGGVYIAKVSDKLTRVRVDAIRETGPAFHRPDGRNVTIYDVTNLTTGRKTTFRSAAKFRGEAKPDAAATKPKPKVDSGQFGARNRDAEEAGFVRPLTDADVKQAEQAIAGAEQRSDPTAAKSAAKRPALVPTDAVPSAANAPGCTGLATPSFAGLAAALAAETAPADDSPHLIVEARAGTGKTTTLVEALKRLQGQPTPGFVPSPQQAAVFDAIGLSRGKARSICFVAFNRSIADELKKRVPAGCEAMTMHSLGVKAVNRHLGRFAVTEYRVLDLLCEIIGADPRELRRREPTLANAVCDLVGLCKQNLADPDEETLLKLAAHHDVDLNHSRSRIIELVPQVLEACKDPSVDRRIDFDDMIWLPVVLGLPMTPFDLLLVDEAQDLNRCQQALAKKVGRRLVLCGDPKQAIYGFAGADAESMPRMQRELSGKFEVVAESATEVSTQFNPGGKGRGCVTLPLTVTRRCGRAIVEEAKKIVPDFEAHESNPEGKVSRAAYPVDEKGKDRTADALKEGGGNYLDQVTYGDFILCRCNAPLVSQCFRLLKAGRRAQIRGRDIGKGLLTTIRKLMKGKVITEGKDVSGGLAIDTNHRTAKYKPEEVAMVVDLLGKLDDWLAEEQKKETAKRFPSDARLIALQDRYDCLLAFCDGAVYVSEVEKRIETIFTDAKELDAVVLSSIHKAKGLEARRVFLIMPKGGECPHPMAKLAWEREQELNLKYVAITRAIEELVYVR